MFLVVYFVNISLYSIIVTHPAPHMCLPTYLSVFSDNSQQQYM